MSSGIRTSPIKKNDKSNGNGVSVKQEERENGKLMNIKTETNTEEAAHSILSDPEDYLEENETLDLDIANGNRKVWLVKLPRYLADQWKKTDNLSGKQLGTVKIKKPSKPGEKLKVKLVLNSQNTDTENIPTDYDLSILNTQVRNSYVFSEENLLKFKQELTEVAEMPDQPVLQPLDSKERNFTPSDPLAQGYQNSRNNMDSPQNQKQYKYFRVQKNDEDGTKKYIPFVKTIPKKTNLVGKIVHDCQIIPNKRDSKYNQVLMKRSNITKEPERPKVTFLTEIPGVVQSNAGPSIRGNNSSTFLRTTNRNKHDGRAIRMPKKDLLDLLFRLFEEYEYWSMKGLKERTRQPESYLKESLESIATLIKKGPYTSKYSLKSEYKRIKDAERRLRLGLDEEEAVVDNNEDEDDDDMEDVV